MVTEWLKRKAEQQRQAARDFLRKDAPSATKAPPPANAAPSSAAARPAGGASSHGAAPQAAGGLVRQKVYSTGNATESGAAALGWQPAGAAALPVQAAAGGVVRGKVYSAK